MYPPAHRQENHGKRIAVIENEFGEVSIDDALVMQAKEEVGDSRRGGASIRAASHTLQASETLPPALGSQGLSAALGIQGLPEHVLVRCGAHFAL